MIAKYKNQNLIPFSPLNQNKDRSFVYGVGMNSKPHAQPVIVAKNANWNSKTSVEQTANGRTCVPSVVSSSQPHNDSAAVATVANDARERPRSDGSGLNGNGQPCNGSVLPLNRGYVVPPIIGNCKHCEKPLSRKSRNGRLPIYCNSKCRVAAYRARQKGGAK